MTRWPPPPSVAASFYKGHGLGNDYLVFEQGDDWVATPGNVRRVCDRHLGVGADGMVVLLSGGADFESEYDTGRPADAAASRSGGSERTGRRVALRMFNPDGSEFERSGNGLRVLASYMLRHDPSIREIDAEVGGGRVRMIAHGRSGSVHDVSVDIGRGRTGPDAVSMAPDVVDDEGQMIGPEGEPLRVVPVYVGNPHVVVLCEDEPELDEGRLATIGPWLATHPALEHGTNVQLALHDGGRRSRALIWERGVGRTSASGTSSCAVAVALIRTGILTPGEVVVRMPGGELSVTVSEELDVVLRGPVEEVMEGRLAEGMP